MQEKADFFFTHKMCNFPSFLEILMMINDDDSLAGCHVAIRSPLACT